MDKKLYYVRWYWVRKKQFHQHKNSISINNLGINKIKVSNEVSFGKKGFNYVIGYKDGKKIRPLCILLPKLRPYRKGLDETKDMSFR